MHVFVILHSASIWSTLISSAVQPSFSPMSFFMYYVNRQGNIRINILVVQMEKVGQNDTEIIKQDSRNALDKIPFYFQSWNIISEKTIEIESAYSNSI